MTSKPTFNTYGPRKQAQIIADLQILFKSNERGYGLGEFQGATFKEDKNKWIPGGVRWVAGPTTTQQWVEHLSGLRLLGQGVLCDDGCVWYACLDIDQYEIDYADEMRKIKNTGLPVVVFRTKSGGLRIIVFFSEGIQANLVVTRMRRMAALLGYAGCEIFPKQTSLDVAGGDCPSWIYIPFGGTHDMFPEQCCMTDNGTAMDLYEAVEHMKQQRITKVQFMELFAAEEAAKMNGKTNGKKHPKGAWVQEASKDVTLNTMFHDGPPCLWYIAHEGCRDMQNNFLVNVCTFLKKKYPENWDKALEWVNYEVLKPAGDREKLAGIIKRGQGHEYEYMCQQEPICSRCFSTACRKQPFGVGSNGHGVDYYEMGMTIIEREPRIFYISHHDTRMIFEASDLLSQQKFKERCLAHGLPMPTTMKKEEWEKLISQNIETANWVKPSAMMRTNAREIEILADYFSIHVPTFIRRHCEEHGYDTVRVRVEEKRIYFKPQPLSRFLRSTNTDDMTLRRFIESNPNCLYHKESGAGIRDWWRWTYSVSFDLFDEDIVYKWMNPDPDPTTESG